MTIDYQISEIDDVAKQVLANLKTKCILIYGPMGVGKTTLIKSLVKLLGSKDEVSSPTFSIVNEYTVLNEKIFHFDLYRLKDLDEAYQIGIEDYLFSGHFCIIEWPEMIENFLTNYDEIELSLKNDMTRKLELKQAF